MEHKNGDLDVALSMYRKCAEIMQAHEMITLSIASILKLQGKYTEAAEEYRKLLSMMNLDVPLEDLEGKGEGSKADRISRVIVGERDVIVGYAELVLDLPFRPGLGMKRPTSQEYTQAINYLKKRKTSCSMKPISNVRRD